MRVRLPPWAQILIKFMITIISSTNRKNRAIRITKNDDRVDTDIELNVRLITFVKSARCRVSNVLLKIKTKGTRKPRKKGIKQIKKSAEEKAKRCLLMASFN